MNDNKVSVKYLGTPIFPNKYYGYIEGERVILITGHTTKINGKTFDCLRKKLGKDVIVLVSALDRQEAKEKEVKEAENKNKGKGKGRKQENVDL